MRRQEQNTQATTMETTPPSDIKVALVGDSVLDDHYWLQEPTEDVREQTERTLRRAHPSRNPQVLNFAVDESTVSCVLRGRAPASHYKAGRRKAGMEAYPMDSDGVVRPLSLLRNARPSHVVSGATPLITHRDRPGVPALSKRNFVLIDTSTLLARNVSVSFDASPHERGRDTRFVVECYP